MTTIEHALPRIHWMRGYNTKGRGKEHTELKSWLNSNPLPGDSVQRWRRRQECDRWGDLLISDPYLPPRGVVEDNDAYDFSGTG
jgi:hypothetical protein